VDTDRLNRWLTLLANFAVLVGLVVLIVEIRQNTDIARAQTRAQISQGLTEGLLDRNDNQEYLEIILKGNRNEELSDVERYQYDRARNARLNYWDNMVYQHRMGLYDDEEFLVQMNVVRRIISSSPGIRDHYCRFRSTISTEFAAEVEADSTNSFC